MTRNEVLELFDRLLAPHGIPRKGKKMPYAAMNGNMFAFVDGDDVLCIRLSKEDLEDFDAEFGTGPVLQYGSVMRGYTAVPEALLADGAVLATWFSKTVTNARALKPKATKR